MYKAIIDTHMCNIQTNWHSYENTLLWKDSVMPKLNWSEYDLAITNLQTPTASKL